MAWMLIGLFSHLASFAFSKHGVGAILLIAAMYLWYKARKRRGSAGSGAASYYDRINTYSQDGPGFEYSRGGSAGPRGEGFFASIASWFREKYRQYYYRKFQRTWEAVQKKYQSDMRCPACGSELTVFAIGADGRCKYCSNRLI